MGKTTAIILAAGKGTRMRSLKPKVLHEVCGITLLECVIEAVQQAGISPVIVVVGDKKEAVKKILEGRPVEIVPHNKKNEFYLTDIISIFYRKGKKINEIKSSNTDEVLGINTQSELAKINQIRHSEILLYHMEQGVTILDCASTFIENHVKIGEGTTIYPFTYICKNVVIGQRCSVGPFVYIKPDTEINNDIEIRNTIER